MIQMLQELGGLLLAGSLLSIGLAVFASFGSGSDGSRGVAMFPQEVIDLAHRLCPGASIADGVFNIDNGFLFFLKDDLGMPQRVRILRDRSAAWLYDPSITWQQYQSFSIDDGETTLADESSTTRPCEPAIRDIVAAAVAAASLKIAASDCADIVVRCGQRSETAPDAVDYLLVEIQDQRRWTLVWRGMGRIRGRETSDTALTPKGAKGAARTLLSFFPPKTIDRSKSRSS